MSGHIKIYIAQDFFAVLLEILKKAMQNKKRACVLYESQNLLEACSIRLWNARFFLPHGYIGDGLDAKYTNDHPIWLQTMNIVDHNTSAIEKTMHDNTMHDNTMHDNILEKENMRRDDDLYVSVGLLPKTIIKTYTQSEKNVMIIDNANSSVDQIIKEYGKEHLKIYVKEKQTWVEY